MLRKKRIFVWVVVAVALTLLGLFDPEKPSVLAQQPTALARDATPRHSERGCGAVGTC